MWTKIILVVFGLAIAYFLYSTMKNLVVLVVNSVVGVFALLGFNYLFNASVAVNIWSVVVTAIGGVFGFILVLIAHYTGLAF